MARHRNKGRARPAGMSDKDIANLQEKLHTKKLPPFVPFTQRIREAERKRRNESTQGESGRLGGAEL